MPDRAPLQPVTMPSSPPVILDDHTVTTIDLHPTRDTRRVLDGRLQLWYQHLSGSIHPLNARAFQGFSKDVMHAGQPKHDVDTLAM
jgi:hypothetical protein